MRTWQYTEKAILYIDHSGCLVACIHVVCSVEELMRYLCVQVCRGNNISSVLSSFNDIAPNKNCNYVMGNWKVLCGPRLWMTLKDLDRKSSSCSFKALRNRLNLPWNTNRKLRGHKNVVSQDRWSLVIGSVILACGSFWQEYVVLHNRWSLMAVVSQDRFHCNQDHPGLKAIPAE